VTPTAYAIQQNTRRFGTGQATAHSDGSIVRLVGEHRGVRSRPLQTRRAGRPIAVILVTDQFVDFGELGRERGDHLALELVDVGAQLDRGSVVQWLVG
jgi:hypothetical protein